MSCSTLQDRKPVFHIEGLEVRFGGKRVLHIDRLDIPHDRFVVILGNSGCGKTTLLETLALMRRTGENGRKSPKVLFYPEQDSEEHYDYVKLWKEKKNQRRTELRRKYFSFMFQRTNLFPQFFVDENVTLSMLVQGTPFEEALRHAHGRMRAIGIGSKILFSAP